MMTNQQAHQHAATRSLTGAAAYVVHVYDEGIDTAVYSAEQVRLYAPMVEIQAVYLNGLQIAHIQAMQGSAVAA